MTAYNKTESYKTVRDSLKNPLKKVVSQLHIDPNFMFFHSILFYFSCDTEMKYFCHYKPL